MGRVWKQTGWIGVDLDGTLAEYHGWKGEMHIGKPIPKMIARVKMWLKTGFEVRLITARAARLNPHTQDVIDAWCEEHIGQALPITASKDYAMIELWDDRCVQVISNTGERVDGKE